MYELISAEDYDNLPDEPDLKFAKTEQICRSNLMAMIREDTSEYFDTMVRLQYMTTLTAAVTELGIPNVQFPEADPNPADHINSFMRAVSGEVTRMRLRASSRTAPYSVRFGVRTKAKIQLKIRQLRATIEEADMPERKREALLGKLDELLAELDQTRLSFARTMKILAAISVVACTGTSFLADAPQAIATITRLIGADKEIEEAEAKRLGTRPEPKLLLPPEAAERPRQVRDTAPAYVDLDDEIPF